MVKITKFKEANINVIITIHTEISIIKVRVSKCTFASRDIIECS